MTGADLVWAIVFALCGLFGIVAFVLMVRRIPRAFRDWWELFQGPLVTATDEELAALRPVWPLGSGRWPSPMPSGEPRMSKVRCHAYARLAAARSRAFRYGSEVLTLLMAALLGLQLPAIADRLGRVSSINDWEDLDPLLGLYLSFLAVVLGIGLAIVCRSHSEDLETARSYYEQAARATSHTVLDPEEPRSAGRFAQLLDLFR